MKQFLPPVSILMFVISASFSAQADPAIPNDVTRVQVIFSGGHDTVGVDRGRPVVLIAAALGVTPGIFREAFSHVHPAGPNRGPTDQEARSNKAALMNALGKYGITNDRLDEVSNYYRYNRSRGEMWTNRSATANALIKDGAIVGYEITNAGAGYSSTPTISVPGIKSTPPKVELAYGKDLPTNGSISAIKLSSGQPQ